MTIEMQEIADGLRIPNKVFLIFSQKKTILAGINKKTVYLIKNI